MAGAAKHGTSNASLRRRDASILGAGLKRQFLNGLKSRGDCLLAQIRPAHIGLQLIEKLIYGEIGSCRGLVGSSAFSGTRFSWLIQFTYLSLF